MAMQLLNQATLNLCMGKKFIITDYAKLKNFDVKTVCTCYNFIFIKPQNPGKKSKSNQTNF